MNCRCCGKKISGNDICLDCVDSASVIASGIDLNGDPIPSIEGMAPEMCKLHYILKKPLGVRCGRKYVVKDLQTDPGYEYYIHQDTTSPEDIWHVAWPVGTPPNSKYRPKLFSDRKEAEAYREEIQRQAMERWGVDAGELQPMGRRPPDWRVYEAQESPQTPNQ